MDNYAEIASLSELRECRQRLEAQTAARKKEIADRYRTFAELFTPLGLSLWLAEQTTSICDIFARVSTIIKIFKGHAEPQE